MELDELRDRLGPFCRAMYNDSDATVTDVWKMPGHAGFSYGFTVSQPFEGGSGGMSESWFLRLPPPNVNWRGTADVLRQVAVLNALDKTDVPHCKVQWSGDDLQWFGRPYFVVPKLEGDVPRFGAGEWAAKLSESTRREMARQAMAALAQVHSIDWEREMRTLGPPVPFIEDVTRWDKFYERAAEPERLSRAPEVRELLLAKIPADAHVGIFHGDFQWSNLFYSFEGQLLAIIDWELVGIGATLNDVGWIATFNDKSAWDHSGAVSGLMPPADELVAMYEEAAGKPTRNLNWFRALAAYKFAIISGFNLGLHRRGKRHDPHWEVIGPSMTSLIERAIVLLGG